MYFFHSFNVQWVLKYSVRTFNYTFIERQSALFNACHSTE